MEISAAAAKSTMPQTGNPTRRHLLGVAPLVAVALIVPSAPAHASTPAVECLADLKSSF
jgi:hypothetical protein